MRKCEKGMKKFFWYTGSYGGEFRRRDAGKCKQARSIDQRRGRAKKERGRGGGRAPRPTPGER